MGSRWAINARQLYGIGIVLLLMFLALRIGRSISAGALPLSQLGYFVPLVIVPYLVKRPRHGLYLLCFSLLLVPFWVNDAYFPIMSVNIFFVLFPLALIGGDLVQHRRPIVLSPITMLLGFAGVVLLAGVARYGLAEYMRYPQVLIQGTLLFFLGLHLCRTRPQLITLILVLAAAFTIRNSIEIVENVVALMSGEVYSAVRTESQGSFFQTTSTGHSALRGFVLPIFIAMFIYATKRHERLLLGAAIVSSAVWIGFSGARIGMISIVIGILFLLWRMPSKRAALSVWLGLLAIAVIAAALVFPNMLQDTLGRIQDFTFGEERRQVAWRLAFEAFISNPLIGTEMGPHHSYFLGRAREMGLLFLVPYSLALWRVWRHISWMRRHETEPITRAFVIGLQAALLTAIFQNFIGTGWQVGEYALIFWLLVGAHEAMFFQARRQHFNAIAANKSPTVPMNDRRQ